MPESPTEVKFLVADDHEVVRQGVSDLISTQSGWKVVAAASSGREAVKFAEDLSPNIAILDISMPELNGMEAARQIRKFAPETKIIVFTMHETEQLVIEVFRSGAHGYVLKSDAGKYLIAAIKEVLAGRHYCSAKFSELIFNTFIRAAETKGEKSDSEDESLSPRERELVQLLVEGKSNKEAAAVLGISVKTIETHRAVIMRKLRLATFSDLVRYAIRNHWIEA